MQSVVSFLFDSTDDALGGIYGNACISRAVQAVLSAAPAGARTSYVKAGDVFFRRLAESPVAFSANTVESETARLLRTSATLTADRAKLQTLLWDFIENVEEQWHTANFTNLISQLVGNALFSVSWVNLPVEVARAADEALAGAPGYAGALQIDVGNAVHRHVFVSGLVNEAIIEGTTIWVRSDDGEELVAPSWVTSVAASKIEVVHDYELRERVPTVTAPSQRSAAAVRTEALLAVTRDSTPRARLLDSVISMRDVTDQSEGHPTALRQLPDSALQHAEVPEKKLTHYVLSLDHPEGQHKARQFKYLLEIESKDWRYLAAQLLRGLAEADIRRVRLSEHGVKYSARIPVVGLNGVMKVVETGWIAREDQPARLTTSYVADAETVVEQDGRVPPVVPSQVQGYARAQAIYDAAVSEAKICASRVVPTPMRVEGSGTEWDGECGYARVRIKDARSSFVRWLRKHGIGYKDHKRGWCVSADSGSQSLARNRGYASAFAEVLLFNGIECDVEWRSD